MASDFLFPEIEREYLESQPVGRLATASPKAVPHVVALCYANDEKRIYINTDLETKKGRNIARNGRIAFIVDEYLNWEENRGVIASGRAGILSTPSIPGGGRPGPWRREKRRSW
jgi:nitroimidazol reductase NimA-like FMN-containing flavoprotein (pyridoxamine 5'-phosphate oxidase superfamily)